MNITFLIGNGFDLNLNLNTRYSDFYKYYIENNPNDLISKSIKEDYEIWSDLEMGLGGFLKNIGDDQIDEFLDSKSTLESKLAEYLTLENNRIQIKDEKALSKEFRNKIINFYSDFSAIEKDHYLQVIGTTNNQINYSFITFNYTNALDMIVSTTQKNYKPFNCHIAGGRSYDDAIIMPHHIHGKLTEDLILGVDNNEQILNDKLKTDSRLTNYIVKSTVNDSLGEKKIEKAKEIIDNSKYICLFGLSIGATDGIWWNYIIEWLNREKENRLVIFIINNKNVLISGQDKIRFRDSIREMMLKRSRCEVSEISVQDQIIIIPNSKIFNLENIIIEGNF